MGGKMDGHKALLGALAEDELGIERTPLTGTVATYL